MSKQPMAIPSWASTDTPIKTWRNCCYTVFYKAFRKYKETGKNDILLFCSCNKCYRTMGYSLKYNGLTFIPEDNENVYAFFINKETAEVEFLFPATSGIWDRDKDIFLGNLVSINMLSPFGMKLIQGKYNNLDDYFKDAASLPDGKRSWIDLDLKMTRVIMILLEGLSVIDLQNKIVSALEKARLEKVKELYADRGTDSPSSISN